MYKRVTAKFKRVLNLPVNTLTHQGIQKAYLNPEP